MWFRKSQLDPLPVTMSGIKLGDRLLVVGAGDPALTAALAAKAGLTGRACVLDATEVVTLEAAAAVKREGVLVEAFTSPWTMLPFEGQAFDVVVVRNVLNHLDAGARLRSVLELYRVLRPGGRAVVIEDSKRRGFTSRLRRSHADPQYERTGGATHVLEAAGFRGVRTLANREGQLFAEGIKAAAT
jgi:ubiquinone/menaquinone biosynthesis C-methylase UbiE